MSTEKKKITTIYVQLFGGEQDGYTAEIPVRDGKPSEMFYVHRNCDTERIRNAERVDRELGDILTSSLAILAYELTGVEIKDGVPGGNQYRYDRCEAADRALTDPAV